MVNRKVNLETTFNMPSSLSLFNHFVLSFKIQTFGTILKWACPLPLVAEASALLVGIKLALANGWLDVIFEPNCKKVVDIFQSLITNVA